MAVNDPKVIGEVYNVENKKCYGFYDFIKLIVKQWMRKLS